MFRFENSSPVFLLLAVGCSSSDDGTSRSQEPNGGSVGTGGEASGASEPSSGTGAGGTGSGGATPGGPSTGGSGTDGASTGGASSGEVDERGFRLIWSDEFEGDSIDPSKWEHEVNCWGGGNGEQQCYVADAKNSYVSDGLLHILALADNPSGAIGGPENNQTTVSLPYSSARLRTAHKADFKYGRIEARLQLPYGQGLWPAFWMLPTDQVYGGWAASGEIDIMEAVNLGASGGNVIYGTIHYGGSWPANVHTGNSTTPPQNVWETFHTYSVEWEAGEIRWFVDETHYGTLDEWSTSTEGADFPAPFDQNFHLLLNVAVEGAWPGPTNGETTFPQQMLVDWVRVYECAADPATGHGCKTADPSIQPGGE